MLVLWISDSWIDLLTLTELLIITITITVSARSNEALYGKSYRYPLCWAEAEEIV